MRKIITFIRVRKSFIIFSLLRILVMVLGLLSNIIVIRKLSVNEFGIYSVAFILIGFLTTFGFSWSSSSILYYGSRERERYGNINKTFWARNIIIFFSLVIITVLFALFRKQINDYVGIEISFLLLIWLYVGVIEDYLVQYFLAVKKQLLSSLISITSKSAFMILIFIFDFDIKFLIILNIISTAMVIFYIFACKSDEIGKFEFEGKWFKEVLNFSLWQLFGFSGLYIINFGDAAVIKHYMTVADVGIYNAAYKLFTNIAGFSYIISSFYASTISSYFEKKEFGKLREFFYRERFYIFAASTFGHILVIILAKPIILFLYGEPYLQSTYILIILLIGSIFRYLSVFYMLYLNTNKKHKIQQSINIVTSVLNIVLDIVFIQIFGLVGPAIATSAAIIITMIYTAFYCEKRIKSTI